MSLILWTLAIAVLAAVTCSLCGVFLVVKREALVAEGLSHSVLPGIIVAYLILEDRSSPLLFVGAGVMGLVMVLLVDAIRQTRLVNADASLGIVFSALFSIGVLLASLHLRNVHFHADCIIDGNLASASLRPLVVGGVELGPKAFFVLLGSLSLVLVFITLFFKELKLMAFDSSLSHSLGFSPRLMHLSWLGLVSVTTVCAFETAGSILVVALMIAPPATAYLVTKRLSSMLWVSATVGALSAAIGFYIGLLLDISPTAPIATASGFLFLGTVVFAPKQGLVSKSRRRVHHRSILFQHLLLGQVARHSRKNPGSSGLTTESAFSAATWSRSQFQAAKRSCLQQNYLIDQGGSLAMTQVGQSVLGRPPIAG